MTNRPYDVALSFFARDVGFARQLYERLSQDLSVFLYERAQDEVSVTRERNRRPGIGWL
jgi:hypothetical protein